MPSTLRAVPRPQGEHSTTASSSYRAGHRCCRCRRTLLRRPSSPCGHWPRRCGSPRDARPGRSRRFQRKIRGAGTGRGRTSPPSDPWRSPDRSVSVTPAAPRDRRESPGCGHAVALVAVLRCITAARRRPRFTGGGPLSVPLAALPGGERPVGEPSRSAVKGAGIKVPGSRLGTMLQLLDRRPLTLHGASGRTSTERRYREAPSCLPQWDTTVGVLRTGHVSVGAPCWDEAAAHPCQVEQGTPRRRSPDPHPGRPSPAARCRPLLLVLVGISR